ncbi:MAG TPA: MFS transporter, partial [Rhodospirillales bacterium]|nr:MFS transporter [Rhodospirillales bacterium]
MTANAKRIFWTITISAALIGSLGLGIRQNFGLFLTDMTRDLELGREAFAFAMALQNIVWGIGTPIVGALADKYGSGKMIALGGIAYAFGLYIMANADGVFGLNMGTGLLIGIGQAGVGFAVL